MTCSINKHKRLKIPYTHNSIFKPSVIINFTRQTKSESKIYIANSQHKITNLKGDFVLKTWLSKIILKIYHSKRCNIIPEKGYFEKAAVKKKIKFN